jgi:hypothetical protein
VKPPREGLGQALLQGGKEIAMGVRPVNKKIVRILGFGLDVFGTNCVANQDDLEKLGDMRPGDRNGGLRHRPGRSHRRTSQVDRRVGAGLLA